MIKKPTVPFVILLLLLSVKIFGEDEILLHIPYMPESFFDQNNWEILDDSYSFQLLKDEKKSFPIHESAPNFTVSSYYDQSGKFSAGDERTLRIQGKLTTYSPQIELILPELDEKSSNSGLISDVGPIASVRINILNLAEDIELTLVLIDDLENKMFINLLGTFHTKKWIEFSYHLPDINIIKRFPGIHIESLKIKALQIIPSEIKDTIEDLHIKYYTKSSELEKLELEENFNSNPYSILPLIEKDVDIVIRNITIYHGY